MSKKAWALGLAISMLWSAGFALAGGDAQTVAVDVAGITFDVPADWRVDSGYDEEMEAHTVYGQNEDQTQYMGLIIYEAGDETLESLTADFKTVEGFGNEQERKIGDLDFVLYDFAADAVIGAFAITPGGRLLMFEFGVATDPRVVAIAMQTLQSVELLPDA
jgi:hypothetical protein